MIELNDQILLSVSKPSRYIGNEINSIQKDPSCVSLKFALCFPDCYEVGMSHLGLRILYGLINAQHDIACERVFALWPDMQAMCAKFNIPLFSLESRLPLYEFDIVGFSLQYELDYTNVLNMLHLGKIAVKAQERKDIFPLVIAGGPAALNPEPMHEFIDAFVIGEAEEVILEILDLCKRQKKENRHDKEAFLKELAKIPGVYVPSLYNLASQIKKRIVKNLNNAYYPVNWIVPYSQIIHDRINLEIMRGCPNLCTFCQAKRVFHPLRIRTKERILELAKSIYKNTGYEGISLLSLSTSDYPEIELLVEALLKEFKEKRVNLSLPSLKPQKSLEGLMQKISQIKKTGLTFAVEAGSERLREILHKDLNIADLKACAYDAYKSGYRLIKLYFMIGLPDEKMQDLDGIIDLALALSELRKTVNRRAAQINLSISQFIPKPHTPLEREKMDGLADIAAKQSYLKEKAKIYPNINLKFHNHRMSFLEGVLCRGDRRISRVIYQAWKKGCIFDAWKEHFNFEAWQQAFQDTGIDPDFYCLHIRQPDDILPWQHIEL